MKKILLALAAGVLALTACQQMEKVTFNPGASEAPVLNGSTVTAESISATITPATMVLGGEAVDPRLVHYSLAIVKVNEDVVSRAVDSDDSSAGVVKAEASAVSSVLVAMGHEYGEKVAISLVVRARLSTSAQNGYLDSEGTIDIPEFTIKKPVSRGGRYAAFDKASTWGITGSIASTGNNWGNSDDPDIVMYTNGTWHVAEGVALTTSDEFKFRENSSWDNNLGGVFTAVDTKFDLEANGSNVKILEDGVYDLLINPDAKKAMIVKHVDDPYAAFSKVSTWGITGSIASTGNNWGNSEDPDIVMYTDGTWHLAKNVALTASDEWKFRENSGWDNNLGGAFAALDTEFAVEANGANIKVTADGNYDILLDPAALKAKVVPAVKLDPPVLD